MDKDQDLGLDLGLDLDQFLTPLILFPVMFADTQLLEKTSLAKGILSCSLR